MPTDPLGAVRMRCLLIAALVFAGPAAAAPPACAAPGEPIQWMADYCMLRMETDDEIAVSGCIEEQRQKPFASACASKLHFKRAMCETMVGNGTRAGTVEHCVRDPAFMGRVVEGGGVGG